MEKENKKYRIIIIILSSLIGIFLVIITTLAIVIFKPNKLEFSEKVSIDNYINSKSDDEETNYDYGIRVYIYLNYEQHPKYNEWLELYGLKNGYESERDKYESGYYLKINNAFYETIKNDFPKLDFVNYEYDSSFYLSYYNIYPENEIIKESNKKMKKIKNKFFNSKCYKNVIDLSHEDYISEIRIVILNPSHYEPWEAPGGL